MGAGLSPGGPRILRLMPGTLSIEQAKVFGLTESTITLVFSVHDGDTPVDGAVSVRVDGDERAVSEGGAGTRLVRIDDLDPATEYTIEIAAPGGAPAERNRYFPGAVRTLAPPQAEQVGTFATLNDLHFGEARIGGVMTEDFEYGEAAPGYDVITNSDYETPYAEFMNADAVSAINGLDVDMTIIKGDIADAGLAEQFDAAARTFAGFEKPHHAFLGNHDHLARRGGAEVDGYAIMGQEPAPRTLDLAGWRLVLLDTTIPGQHDGGFDAGRREWLRQALVESGRLGMPTLLFMHHHPVPPEHAKGYPNSIGLDPADSLELFGLLGAHAQVKGVLIGHTHRNKIRRYSASGRIPFVEVANPKDYPGGFGHYRLFADGSFRQEVRRTPSERALAHSTRCRSLFDGGYQHFALGALEERSFATTP